MMNRYAAAILAALALPIGVKALAQTAPPTSPMPPTQPQQQPPSPEMEVLNAFLARERQQHQQDATEMQAQIRNMQAQLAAVSKERDAAKAEHEKDVKALADQAAALKAQIGEGTKDTP